jgi:predicted O-methyltransferase YrrM
MLEPTKNSLDILKFISEQIQNLMFIHLNHFLLDIAWSYPENYTLNYLEIGCFAGGSSALMLQRQNTNVVSVDLGLIVAPALAIANVQKLKKQNTNFNYVQGNSHDENTVTKVKNLYSEYDIFYIDGDSDFLSVVKDFRLYKDVIKKGGYIIFNDFLEKKPNYRSLFDASEFETIGYIQNTFSARPDLKESLYVIRKI